MDLLSISFHATTFRNGLKDGIPPYCNTTLEVHVLPTSLYRSWTWLSFKTESGSMTTTIEAEMGFALMDSNLSHVHVLDSNTSSMKEIYVQLRLLTPTYIPMESSQPVKYQGRSVRLSLRTSRGGKHLVQTVWFDEGGKMRDVNIQVLTVPTCVRCHNKDT